MPLRFALAVPASFLALASALAVSALADRPARTPRRRIDCIEHPLGPADQFTVIIHGDLVQGQGGGSTARAASPSAATRRCENYGVATRWPDEPTRVDLAVGGTWSRPTSTPRTAA